jgi:hypothetical protein
MDWGNVRLELKHRDEMKGSFFEPDRKDDSKQGLGVS